MNDKIKELELKIVSTPDNMQKVDALNELVWELKYINLDRAFELGDEAFQLATSLSYHRGLAYHFRNKGGCYSLISKYDESVAILSKALPLFEELNDHHGLATTLNAMGFAQYRLGQYPLALDSLFKSYQFCQEIDDKYTEMAALGNIGNVYLLLGDYSLSLEYQLKSLHIAQKIENCQVEISLLNNISNVYFEDGDFEKCLSFRLKGLEIAESMQDQRGIASLSTNIGHVYERLGDYEQALEFHVKGLNIQIERDDAYGQAIAMFCLGDLYRITANYEKAETNYRKSLDVVHRVGDKNLEIHNLNGLGELLLNQNQFDQALSFLQQALSIAEEVQSKRAIYTTYRLLSIAYQSKGDFEKALFCFQKYHAVERDVFNENADFRLKSLQVRHQVETLQKEAEIYRLKTIELADTNQRLEQMNHEQQTFFEIVSHGLKNPLAAIMLSASTLNQFLDRISRQKLKQHLKNILVACERMNDIVSNLINIQAIETGSTQLFYEEIDLNILAENVLDGLRERATYKQINLHLEKHNTQTLITVDRKAMFDILDNLISNAIKFSPANKNKNIYLRIVSTKEMVRCEIQDEGPGISKNDQSKLFQRFTRLKNKPTANEHSSGLGLSIAKKLTEMMQGRVWCESKEGEGAIFIVELPRSKNQ